MDAAAEGKVPAAQLLESGALSANPNAVLQAVSVKCYVDYAANRDNGHKSCLAWFADGDGCQTPSAVGGCTGININSLLAVAAPGCHITFYDNSHCGNTTDSFIGPDPPQPSGSKFLSLQVLEGLDTRVKKIGGNWSG